MNFINNAGLGRGTSPTPYLDVVNETDPSIPKMKTSRTRPKWPRRISRISRWTIWVRECVKGGGKDKGRGKGNRGNKGNGKAGSSPLTGCCECGGRQCKDQCAKLVLNLDSLRVAYTVPARRRGANERASVSYPARFLDDLLLFFGRLLLFQNSAMLVFYCSRSLRCSFAAISVSCIIYDPCARLRIFRDYCPCGQQYM